MELEKAIGGRRSVREYGDQAVDDRTVQRLIDAAIAAPSAVNEQPWHFTVVRDQALLDRISLEAKDHMLTTLTAGAQSDHFRPLLTDPNFHIFYHAPVLIVIAAEAQGRWVVEDCTLAAENLMLSAYAASLGSCWIGFAQSYLNTTDGKAMLGLVPTATVVAPIIVGHPTAVPPPVPRKEPRINWIG